MKRTGLGILLILSAILVIPAFGQRSGKVWTAESSERVNYNGFPKVLAADTNSNLNTACAYVTIGEVTGDPCQVVEVPVTLTAFRDIGGFNFCIEFRNTDLTVLSVRRGDLIDDVDSLNNNKYKWHYFTFRLIPTTITYKYKLCVVGIGRVYSSYPGMCLPGTGQPGVLFYIKFYLTCNEQLRCCDSHLDFQWDSTTCLENTLIDCTGDTLLVSGIDTQYNPDSCGLGYNTIVPCVQFDNGRVIFRCIPGDVNASGTITLGDIVHLVNYYLDKDGPGCVGSDSGNCWTPVPICRGDINNSASITLGDVVHLVNYVFDRDNPPCLGIDPGNCWTPVGSAACCPEVP